MYTYLERISSGLKWLPFFSIGLLFISPLINYAAASSQVMSNDNQAQAIKRSDRVESAIAQPNSSSALSLDWTQTNGIRLLNNSWSGYEVKRPDYTVSMVRGTWTVPTVKCSNGDSFSYVFVGIDGISSGTVEQVGTSQECHENGANYFAWYELYPAGPVRLRLSIHPGDRILGNVEYRGKDEFLLALKNQTTGESFSTVQIMVGARRSSAEWIVELPDKQFLANFGSVLMTSSQTVINGTSGPIGSFPDYTSVDMVSRDGPVQTQTFGLSQGGESFKIVWYHP